MASILFVAGDPSGDVHAAHLIEALKTKRADLTFAGLGGPAMQQAGTVLLDDLTHAAAIGPFDAARHLNRFRRALRLLEDRLKTHPPDLVILVDFGDFNLPFVAPLVKRYRVPIVYYISPQIWAWGRWRLRYIRRYVDRMIVFFPFERDFYQRAGVAVTWVGHPLVEMARPSMSPEVARERFGVNPWRRTVGLLPGSRADEVRRHLPLMLKAAEQATWHMPGLQWLLPRAPSISRADLDTHLLRARVDVRIAEGSIYDTLQLMESALVASGTATLEAALCEVPMVVIYRTSWPTYFAARAVVRIPHIALVNVVAERAVVPELIQHRAQPKRIAEALIRLLRDDELVARTKVDLRAVRMRLGEPARPADLPLTMAWAGGERDRRTGGAVDRAASTVLEHL